MKDELLYLVEAHITSLATKIEEEGDPRVLTIFTARKGKLETLRGVLQSAPYASPELCEGLRDELEKILKGEDRLERGEPLPTSNSIPILPEDLQRARLNTFSDADTYGRSRTTPVSVGDRVLVTEGYYAGREGHICSVSSFPLVGVILIALEHPSQSMKCWMSYSHLKLLPIIPPEAAVNNSTGSSEVTAYAQAMDSLAKIHRNALYGKLGGVAFNKRHLPNPISEELEPHRLVFRTQIGPYAGEKVFAQPDRPFRGHRLEILDDSAFFLFDIRIGNLMLRRPNMDLRQSNPSAWLSAERYPVLDPEDARFHEHCKRVLEDYQRNFYDWSTCEISQRIELYVRNDTDREREFEAHLYGWEVAR